MLVDVTFRLDCSGTSHVDAGQLVRLTPGPRTVPFGGSFHVGTVLLIPSVGWPADGQDCPAGLTPVSVVHHITVTAPATEGTDLRYVFSWTRSLVQPTTGDVGVLEGTNPSVTFILDVSDNTPPALVLPADSTVEGDTTGGATAAYDVSATDAEDATAPTPVCVPAVGDALPLGTTTVACSATDSGGLEATGSFDITVVDTTAPTLAGMPADRSITTAAAAGATVTFTTPTASDLVDAAPAVQCAPASGSLFPVGSTTVTCTARDASGNRSSSSFAVDVTYVPADRLDGDLGRAGRFGRRGIRGEPWPDGPGQGRTLRRWRRTLVRRGLARCGGVRRRGGAASPAGLGRRPLDGPPRYRAARRRLSGRDRLARRPRCRLVPDGAARRGDRRQEALIAPARPPLS